MKFEFDDDGQLAQVADELREMGDLEPHVKPKPDPQTHIVDGGITMKCACDKVVRTLDMPRCHSGVVPFIDNICPGCEDQAKGLCPVVCTTCHRVAGRLKPCKDKWGFKVEKGRSYHIERCPSCTPGEFKAGTTGQIAKTPIIEMILYHKRMGVQS